MRAGCADSVDAYLAEVPSKEARLALERIRVIVREEVPLAEEVIAYQIPSYKLNGYLLGFAAFKKHCSLFPGVIVADYAEELRDYKTSTGTIQFTPEHPIPETLLRSMIRARVTQLEQRRPTKKKLKGGEA